MWSETHEMTFPDLSRESVWAAWEDVNNWHRWDTDIEHARTAEPFREGARLQLKPRGGPTVNIRFTRVDPLQGYTDLARFPLARMYGIHDMTDTSEGLRLTITIRVEGPLGWLWTALVARKVAAEAPAQLESLAGYVRQQRIPSNDGTVDEPARH